MFVYFPHTKNSIDTEFSMSNILKYNDIAQYKA